MQVTTEDISVICNPTPDQDCLEKADATVVWPDKPDPLASLTLRRVCALASEDLKLRIDLKKGQCFVPNWHAIEPAAHEIRPDLGISVDGWTHAIQTMGGRLLVTLALVLTDARCEHPDDPVKNPGGYLCGVKRAHRRGRLNIVGSLEGQSARRRRAFA